MDSYVDKKISEILQYLKCNTIDEAFKKLDQLQSNLRINKQKKMTDF